MKKLLVIDDEPGHRLMVRAVLEDAGWLVTDAASGEEGVALFASLGGDADVALVDMKMPGMNGQQTLKKLHEIRSGLPVILLTAYGSVGSAVEAMKQGAFDYLTKPADNDELVLTLNRAWEYSRLLQENDRLLMERAGEGRIATIVGTSTGIRQIHDFIRQAGPSEATVLITGESGTGKERIAEALHAASPRNNRPLVKVNCAALPAQLLESELFGYERGAFTGAVKDKPGRFQLASGGTLFLDEIGEIPLDLQAKLLRVIQERELEPLGSVRTIPVDVRILAATNKNLHQAVLQKTFREDLFFRLNVLEIVSPPLREHAEDIPLLVSHLLRQLAEKNRKSIRGVSPAFLAALSRHSWPGNVRELENVLERALILSRSDILESDSLPPALFGAGDGAPRPAEQQLDFPLGTHALRTPPKESALPGADPASQSGLATPSWPGFPQGDRVAGNENPMSPLDEAERIALIQALQENNSHREKTADALGISRRTLQYKLKKFGLIRR